MSNNNKIIIDRLRTLRTRAGLTQRELARHAGLASEQSVEKIEEGTRSIKAAELYLLAKVLHVEMASFMKDADEVAPIKVFWRQPPAQAEAIEDEFVMKCKNYRRVEELCAIASPKTFPEYGDCLMDMNWSKAGEYANSIRKLFDLGKWPAQSLVKTLEDDFSVKIFYKDMEEGSAASTQSDFGYGILMNSKEAPWRRNFNFAHELFHLVTWKQTVEAIDDKSEDSREHIEKLANVFASNLLIPAEYLLEEITSRLDKNGKITYLDLVNLARNFGVSSEALIWRLVNLKRLTQEKAKELLHNESFRSMDRESMCGRWIDAPPLPERYVLLAYEAYQKGFMSRMMLADYLECSLMELDSKLKLFGITDCDEFDTEVTIA